MREMVYCDNGEIVLDTDAVVAVDPAFEGRVREMRGFVPVAEYRVFRIPIDGELGSVGQTRIVVSRARRP